MVMVFFTEKLSRVLAACCNVEVIKGALGLVRVGRSSRWATAKLASRNAATAASVVS
jgi:hypothetical protein